MASPAELVESVFGRAAELSTQSLLKHDRLSNQSYAVAAEGADFTRADLDGLGTLPKIPRVNIPREAETASVHKFDEFAEKTVSKLATLFRDYLSRYFPNNCDSLRHAQQKLCEMLTRGGTSINPVVEDQIWQRDRTRVLNEVNRAGREVLATFAARGFPVPPGAALHQMNMIQQDAQNKIAQASRDVAIKQVEIEIENVRFAVDKAIGLYQTAIAAAIDYIKALAIGPQLAAQVVPSVTDSQSRLIGAASDYYRAQLQASELLQRHKVADAEIDARGNEKAADLQMQRISNRLQAMMEYSKSVATQAAAALNAMHASAGVSASASNSVGYSYGGDVSSEVPPKTTT